MNLKNWLHNHSLKLLAIRDTPEAIAGGVAIGVFFGFSPFFGFKTLLSLLFAWLMRCNLLAAVIAVTLHDLTWPFIPVIYRFEYDLGFWLRSSPHHFPPPLRHMHWDARAWPSFGVFYNTIGKPLMLGSIVFGTPCAVATFFLTRQGLIAYRRKHPRPPETPQAPGAV